VTHVLHGTTLFTNAIIERKGARTALVTTKGFRDAVEIAREHRYDMYDLYMQRPRPIAPRHLRFEVDERMLVDGSARRPVDPEEVRRLAERLRAERIEAVGVCLLHAYANPAHERLVGRILREALPEVAVTLSSELVPEIREYERTSTTLANVYVQRLAQRYLGRLGDRLRGIGVSGGLFIMQSNGGLCEAETGGRYPVRLIESGPAAGALAAAHHGVLLGHKDLLSFDMGGTTAKACVIADGEPLVSPEFEVDRRYHFKKGSGLPIKVPVIEMIEIGTGGGSIARVDALRRLLVGPESAGARPGPVAYGLGGTEPTVTDAAVVLGWIDPAYFLGGLLALDAEASRTVLETIARPLDMSVEEAAYAAVTIASENVIGAIREITIAQGIDPREYSLVAGGGASGLNVVPIARELGSKRVLLPSTAGALSACGALFSDVISEFSRSRYAETRTLERARVLGVALRVAYLISASTPGVLPKTPMTVERGRLVLRFARGLHDLAGDRVFARLRQLAKLIGREPVMELK
jgi:N-methylhydantoinase A